MRRAHFILPFKLCAKTFVYTETDDVIGTVTPYVVASLNKSYLPILSCVPFDHAFSLKDLNRPKWCRLKRNRYLITETPSHTTTCVQ